MYENYVIDQNKENDSGIENDSGMFVRVCIAELNMQKVFKFNLDETVWNCKQKILQSVARELRDGINYGFYLPPYQGRAGKFLDDCRLLREYSLSGPVANLEFKHKKRVYKFVKLNPKEIKAINQKAYLKRFLDYVRTNNVSKVNKLMAKGLDPNFHSDLGETPLTIAVSLASTPSDMIMALYSGGAHLDFRSRDSFTPMHKAAILGNEKAIDTLIELRGFVNVRDSKNLTPLFYAISNANSVECMELLLYNGAQVDCYDDQNWREMHYACKLGLSQHLDHLIYYGADINSQNNSGNTPLHVSAIHNCENCTRILLFRGADRRVRNLSNQTAYDVACIAGNTSIAELIKSHRDCDIVPIREKPQVAKRKTLHVDSLSSQAKSHYASMTNVNYSTLTTNSLSKSSKSTVNLWQKHSHVAQQNVTPQSSLRSRSMPKINPDMNDACDSPLSGSNRSLSSDDHGFGSASLSQLSGSPNIEYTYPRKRLYQSIPNRNFICIRAFKPTQPGEMELKKGDVIELLSVGEKAFWEGRKSSTNAEGWFPSDCVQEFHATNDSADHDSIIVKRKTLLDLITNTDVNMPRVIVLQRGKKGFGFVLRGAKLADAKFEPTPEIPALQFLENVDKGSNAEKAGLKPLDFVLEINGNDVTCRTHDECVKLIKKSGDTLALKVLTVNYNSNQSTQLSTNIHATVTSSCSSSASNVLTDGTKSLPHNKKPVPPKRNPNTSLTSIDICSTNSLIKTSSVSLLGKYKSISKSTSNINKQDSMSTTSKIQFLLSKSKQNASTNRLNKHQPSSDTTTATSTTTNTYMSSVFAQIDELDKTLAEYERKAINSSIRSNILTNQTSDNNFNTMMSLQAKTMSYPNIAYETSSPITQTSLDLTQTNTESTLTHENIDNRASSDTLVHEETTFKEPDVDYDEDDLTHYASTSVTTSPPPVPPPPPPPLAFSNSSNPILSTFSTNNSLKSSPLTPRQLKQRNSAKKLFLGGDADTNFVDDQLIEQLKSLTFNNAFINSSKEFFIRNPTKTLQVNLTNIVVASSRTTQMELPHEIELNKEVFEKIISSVQQQQTSKTPPQVPIRTSSSMLSLNTLNPNMSLSGSTTNINDTLTEQIKRAAQERLIKMQNGETLRNSAQRQSIDVKSELEQAIEKSRLKRMSIDYESSTSTNRRNQPHDPPPPPPPLLSTIEPSEVVEQSIKLNLLPPPPPPPITSLQTPSTSTIDLPPPPSPTQLSRLTTSNSVVQPVIKALQSPRYVAASASSGQTLSFNSKPTQLLPTPTHVAADPRLSNDFGAMIAKKAAEKCAKFQENKPSVHTITYNAPKVVTYATSANVQKINLNATNNAPLRQHYDGKSY